MSKRITGLILFIFMVLAMEAIFTACSANNGSIVTPDTATPTLDAAAAEAVLQSTCNQCHPLSRVTTKTKTAEQWQVTVDRMILHGAKLSSAQEQNLVEYLAQNY